jgi:hypothetical protein
VIKEHPILFSTAMISALLDGRKTQTRRIFKDHPRLRSDLSKVDLKAWMGNHPEYILSFCPYGKPGDVLWVRESFSFYEPDGYGFNYKADFTDAHTFKWKPSIHMPKDAARIWLQVEEVRVERLQDISEIDAFAEGVEKVNRMWRYYLGDGNGLVSFPSDSYRSLWEKLNGEDSWQLNPWVWVVEFKILSINGRDHEGV